MARMSEKRKAELQDKYGNGAFAPMQKKYLDKARELSARYILFVNKDNRHGYCESCCSDVEFEKTKHKSLVTCPNCGKELLAVHTWRKKNCEWDIDWYVVGEAVDNETMLLRYIRVEWGQNFLRTIAECAREIYDFKHGWSYKFGLTVDGWIVNDNYYFREFNMYSRRRQCCIAAESLNNIMVELSKITQLKYFDQLPRYFRKYVYPRDNISQLMSASLYEKLEKVGMGNIAMQDYEHYNCRLKYKRSETSLLKMLGINKLQYNLLFSNTSLEALSFIRENKNMDMKKLEYIVSNNAMYTYKSLEDMASNDKERWKLYKYLVTQKINKWEYNHYIYTLKELKYKLDDSYLFPKDFRKADTRVSDEYQAMKDKETLKQKRKQNGLIKKISEGLRNMPDLQEFLNGSNGLLVYVPDSAKDLMDEGRAQHNCVGTYIDRIADGKTLVFFVRRLNSPNDPFVTFEYCNGEIIQCRYDHNVAVEDDNIINFVDKFAEMLRKNKVLYAA